MKKLIQIAALSLMVVALGRKTVRAQETVNTTSDATLVQAVGLTGKEVSSFDTLSDQQLKALIGILDATPIIPAGDLPKSGTFRSLKEPSWPPLPGDLAGAGAWELTDGTYLLDDATLATSQATMAATTTSATTMSAMDSSGPPSPGVTNDAATNSYTANLTGFAVNYGTNLFLANVGVTNGWLGALASNTLPGVSYTIQWTTNLSAPQSWQNSGMIVGSALTNWTAWSVPQGNWTNLFLRLRSEISSDGTGLPDWWEALYFGTNTINPDAQDSAGDGYTIYQKYELGVAPTSWLTPAAPQGFTVTYNAALNTATFKWLTAFGTVTGYTISDSLGNHYTASATATSLTISTAGLQANPWAYGNIQVTYSMVANYGAGTSAATLSVPLEPTNLAGAIVQGSQGVLQLVLSALPAGAAAIQLTEISESALNGEDTNFYITNVTILASSLSNGVCTLPNWVNVNNLGTDGTYGYEWVGRVVGTDGSLGAAVFLANENVTGMEGDYSTVQMAPPYFDGRAQLKQDLIFQLRAASMEAPVHFAIPETNDFDFGPFGAYVGDYIYSPAYAYAGFYQFANQPSYSSGVNYNTFDPYLPVEENCLFRNFIFTPENSDENGTLTTGLDGHVVVGFGLPGNDSVWLSRPLTYEFDTSWTTFPALLDANTARWSFYEQALYGDDLYGTGLYGIDYNDGAITMSAGYHNWFGMPYISANVAYNDIWSGNLATNVVFAGSETILPEGDASIVAESDIYPATALPKFRTVEYDFWPSLVRGDGGKYAPPILPGNPAFSITNTGQSKFVVGVGEQVQIVGYAKLEVTNSVYSGVYGYLGQYFDQGYEIDASGALTSTNAGVLSPYGDFVATRPGLAGLVTMADIDTGAQGTCSVYCVSLQLDANHDGNMDLSFNGTDATSPNSPYVFWANNNFDRWGTDSDGIATMPLGIYFSETEQDDQQIAFSPLTPTTPTPDCNYSNVFNDGYAYRAIPCTRDLEDFSRLWVCGIPTNLLAQLPSGSTVTLSWGDVGNPNSANPTIDLFAAADANGGIGYQTNEVTASNQINAVQSPYIGRLGPGGSLQLNASQFANSWAGNYFIWCGVSNGTGGLTLTIADGSGNMLAQTTSYIQIVDIKQMYERYTVGDNPAIAPLTAPILASENLPPGVPSFQYPQPQNTSTPYILHVHGYNMQSWEKDRFAETEFKRLYWQGYQGRFGSFRWPTTFTSYLRAFDDSESNAWASATGLASLLTKLNAVYLNHVYLTAHSHGNVVAGEALRQATQQGLGQIVNTYIAMQGAVDAHAYDPTTPQRPVSFSTPDCYGQYYTSGAGSYFNGSAGAGTYVNFFNTNDWALSANVWQRDQNLKPDSGWGYQTPIPYVAGYFYRNLGDGDRTGIYFPTSTYEIFSYCDQAHAYALGAQPGVNGMFDGNQVSLPSVWPSDPSGQNYNAHVWHSAEFRSDYPQRWLFWDEALFQMGLKTHL